MPQIHGQCDPRLEGLRRAFAENFASRDEIGAAVAVTLGGELVADLWGGHADPARTRPWQRDTLVCVYSTTKGMTALCAHRLADQGKLDLHAPVSDVWPEFAQAGKSEVPVMWLLCHRAGLPAIRESLPAESLYDWDVCTQALARQTPWWPPGETLAYHPITFGWLVGEVVRRVSGRSVGTYLREEIAEPLGADFHIGLRDAEIARCAEITRVPPPEGFDMSGASRGPDGNMAVLAFMNPLGTGDHNSEPYRRAEIPAIGGHGTARALARVYGALAVGGTLDGYRLLSREAVERCWVEQASGEEATLGLPMRLGAGFMLSDPAPGSPIRFGPNPHPFGHTGAGGSAAFADPDARIGFAYVCNRMGPHLDLDPRVRALIDACYASI